MKIILSGCKLNAANSFDIIITHFYSRVPISYFLEKAILLILISIFDFVHSTNVRVSF
jgi:hypothetical protein